MMRKRICIVTSILTLISLLTGCTRDVVFEKDKVNTEVIKSNNEFAFDIFARINEEDKDENVFISPFSISTALSVTVQGAETTTKDSMMEALKYEGIDLDEVNAVYKYMLHYLNEVDKKIELDINNSIWINDGKDIKKDFINVNKNTFNAHVSQLDFSKKDAADEMNKWVKDATNKKIDKIVEPPISDRVEMYLINAIYFKGEWTDKFKKINTSDSDFHSGNGETKVVKMMERMDRIEYGQKEDFKAVRLPYGEGKTSMYCILPSEDISINDFIKTLDADKWQEIRQSVSEVGDVLLNIPRFKMEYESKDLKEFLISMGMEEAFLEEADFSGISDEGLYIDSVLHKAVIEVNEKGSEAAATTSIKMNTKDAGMLDPPSFIADRPFLFFITEDNTGTILFMGKLYDYGL